MKKYVIIKADTNDGDYITRQTLLNDKTEELVKKVCKVIIKDKSWGKGECIDESNNPERWVESGELTEEEVDTFNYLVPGGEHGVHTIESVQILTVTEEENLI